MQNLQIYLTLLVATLFVTGLASLYFLQGFKETSDEKYYKVWSSSIHGQIVLTLIVFTPIIELIMNQRSADYLRAITTIVLVIWSSYIKTLREEAVS